MRLTEIDSKGRNKKPIELDLSKAMGVAGSIALTAGAMGLAQKWGYLGRTTRAIQGEALAGALGVAGYKVGEEGGKRAGQGIQERYTAKEGRSEIIKRSWRARRQKYGKRGRSR